MFIHHKRLTPDEIRNGAIFTCASFSFAPIRAKISIFVFDSHSRNSQGVHIPNGQSVSQSVSHFRVTFNKGIEFVYHEIL